VRARKEACVKALVLNGAVALRGMARAVDDALTPRLEARGYAVARHDLTSLAIPDCRGDFGCWTVTPGVCVHAGPHRDVARDLIRSDLAVWLTPVTFGGYSSALKRQLDHCIPLISPRFTTVDGETHHETRYERFPSVLAVGLMERPDAEAARVFERLVRRNVLNMYAPHFACPVLARAELPPPGSRVSRWLDDLAASRPPHVGAEPLDLSAREDLPEEVPRRALLLGGSPRGDASVSSALLAHLATLLAERGLTVETESLQRSSSGDPELRGLQARLAEADVVVLATPLYVDSLPGPVTAALELLARRREPGSSSRPRFLALVNCGFPEAVHNDTALAICRLFAKQARLEWIGGLGIGGGGMLAGRPLAELGARARSVTRALSLTADAIARGRVVPEEARRLVARRPIPRWLYRLMANWGFRQEARRYGTLARQGARPYAA
jgi:NAD(P)H-dependent FMN reductase